jgi:hypothetical protein
MAQSQGVRVATAWKKESFSDVFRYFRLEKGAHPKSIRDDVVARGVVEGIERQFQRGISYNAQLVPDPRKAIPL